MKKKIISLLLAIVMVCSIIPTAFAASDEAVTAADALHELGLFNGTGTDANGKPIYDLDRAPTRAEAVTMLVRLLGKEEEAKGGNWNIPFTDVADWAKPYVGYAYANKLTSGTSATTFGGDALVTASQYITFVLRALGYNSGTDFQWDRAWELSDEIGLTDGRYNAETTEFLRGDVAIISLSAHKVSEVIKTAPYWGLSANIKWISEPQTQEDLNNNICYSFLFGNYSLNFTNVTTTPEIDAKMLQNVMRTSVKDLSRTYPELAGVFCNTFVGCGAGSSGVFIDFPQSTLTTEEIYKQQLAVLEIAQSIKAELWEQGKITSAMSQLEIAEVYYQYLSSLNVQNGIGKSDPSCVEYDSAYAALVNRKADCVGKAGAFNLLMHLEGISAQGVAGKIKGTDSGHVLSRVVLGGKEYFCDWGNKKGISQNINSWFEFDEVSLEAARAIS